MTRFIIKLHYHTMNNFTDVSTNKILNVSSSGDFHLFVASCPLLLLVFFLHLLFLLKQSNHDKLHPHQQQSHNSKQLKRRIPRRQDGQFTQTSSFLIIHNFSPQIIEAIRTTRICRCRYYIRNITKFLSTSSSIQTKDLFISAMYSSEIFGFLQLHKTKNKVSLILLRHLH